jgi:hypothetical protein
MAILVCYIFDGSVPSPGKHQEFWAQTSSKSASHCNFYHSHIVFSTFPPISFKFFFWILLKTQMRFILDLQVPVAHWDDFKTKLHDVNGLKQWSAECASFCAEHYFFFCKYIVAFANLNRWSKREKCKTKLASTLIHIVKDWQNQCSVVGLL